MAAPESLVLKFVAHHLWNPAKRETDPHHGMPAEVATALRDALLLRSAGPHAPLTVQTPVGELGHVASLERAGGAIPRAQSSRRPPAGGPGQHQASAA